MAMILTPASENKVGDCFRTIKSQQYPTVLHALFQIGSAALAALRVSWRKYDSWPLPAANVPGENHDKHLDLGLRLVADDLHRSGAGLGDTP
jgi:hypothetical protein